MMKTAEAFPSKYLTQEDVEQAGIIRATIKDCLIETFGQGEKAKDRPVLYFREREIKPLRLNKTNWKILVKTYGDETDGWITKIVDIYHDPNVAFGDDIVGGIRIRIPSSAVQTPTTLAAEPLALTQAVIQAAAVGMTREQLIEALQKRGLKGYNSVKDAAAARDIISAAAEAKAVDDTIPF